MQVPRLVSVVVFRFFVQHLGQTPQARDSQDVYVVVAAKGLQQLEVDLESDVVQVLLVGGQDAEHNAVGIAARNETKKTLKCNPQIVQYSGYETVLS